MDKLIKSLPAILAASGGAEEVAEAACIAAWKHAAGEALSFHAVPMGFKDQALVVAVADLIWQKQLEQLRGQLLFRLSQVLGQQVVTSIELKVRPDKFRGAGEPDARPRSGSSVGADRSLEARDSALAGNSGQVNNSAVPFELLSAAAGIEDARLRRAFLGAAVSCVNRNERS
ncbi:MAG TPA: DUF721 domain-containing protein [Pyrinomonadaceae bacterium]|nr:DUF721 domain-containing protein [Pyrinomonadaceae bacterium]